MIKQTLLIGFFGIALFGCASAPLPQDQRELTYVEQTSAKQKDAYNAVLSYLAKNLGDSNFAIKVKDPESGTVITQIAFDCPELKDFLDLNRHMPTFNLEVATKDNKARLVFEALNDRVYNAVGGALISERVISRASQVASAKTCVEREKTNILSAISAKKSSW